jgi:hypothetical protein
LTLPSQRADNNDIIYQQCSCYSAVTSAYLTISFRRPILFFLHHFQPSSNQTNNHKLFFSNQKSIIMSAPNVDKPNEGIVGQVTNSISNAANYVSETLQGSSAEAQKEAHKQQAKGNAGDTSITGRIGGALNATGDKIDESKHKTAASANKEAI